METKDGAVVFLVLLSVALFTTLAYSVWLNGSEIAQLQAELQNVRQEESTSQNAASHLPAKVGLKCLQCPCTISLEGAQSTLVVLLFTD